MDFIVTDRCIQFYLLSKIPRGPGIFKEYSTDELIVYLWLLPVEFLKILVCSIIKLD